jgi:gliding motility-associatede transport system auxiliary component
MKKVESWLYSVLGVVAVLVILIAINLLGNLLKFRSDLTENKLYTLSEGTKRILGKLDTEVEIRFYFSKDNAAMPVPLRTYAQQVEDLLSEYVQNSHGKIRVKKLDPIPDSDAEDSANLDGVDGQAINLTDKVYLGLAVSCLDAKAAIPFLSPDREALLEYDISRAMSSVINPKKTVIGVMSALPVTGQAAPMMMLQRQQPSRPWVFLTELKQNYEVRNVPLTADKIDDDLSVLVLIHPKGITEQAQFAIDQYLLRGGKLVALLDPLSFVDSQLSGQGGMMNGQSFSSSLDKLLPAWGLKFTDREVVGDPVFATQVQRESGSTSDPTVLSITADGLNKKDPLGAVTNDLLIPFAGAFTGTPAVGLKEEVLVTTSKQAGLVDIMTAQMGADAVRKELKAHNGQFALAVRLTGRFKTAFASGRPTGSEKEQAKPDPSPTPVPSPSPSAAPPALKEGKADTVVVLVGDSDLVYDGIAGRTEQALNQTIFVPSNGNLNFIQSCIEELAGDSNLIGIRSRASGNRPFVVVNKMEARAEEKYQSKIDELETSLADTRQKLSELQSGKQTDEKMVLSPEQQAEIKKFHASEANINQELKQVRKNLRQEIDSLQNNLKWLNLFGMPALVTIVGLTLAGVKRRKRAAR